jgi:hypothetical protein
MHWDDLWFLQCMPLNLFWICFCDFSMCNISTANYMGDKTQKQNKASQCLTAATLHSAVSLLFSVQYTSTCFMQYGTCGLAAKCQYFKETYCLHHFTALTTEADLITINNFIYCWSIFTLPCLKFFKSKSLRFEHFTFIMLQLTFTVLCKKNVVLGRTNLPTLST